MFLRVSQIIPIVNSSNDADVATLCVYVKGCGTTMQLLVVLTWIFELVLKIIIFL